MKEKIDELKLILNLDDINLLTIQLNKLFNTCDRANEEPIIFKLIISCLNIMAINQFNDNVCNIIVSVINEYIDIINISNLQIVIKQYLCLFESSKNNDNLIDCISIILKTLKKNYTSSGNDSNSQLKIEDHVAIFFDTFINTNWPEHRLLNILKFISELEVSSSILDQLLEKIFKYCNSTNNKINLRKVLIELIRTCKNDRCSIIINFFFPFIESLENKVDKLYFLDICWCSLGEFQMVFKRESCVKLFLNLTKVKSINLNFMVIAVLLSLASSSTYSNTVQNILKKEVEIYFKNVVIFNESSWFNEKDTLNIHKSTKELFLVNFTSNFQFNLNKLIAYSFEPNHECDILFTSFVEFAFLMFDSGCITKVDPNLNYFEISHSLPLSGNYIALAVNLCLKMCHTNPNLLQLILQLLIFRCLNSTSSHIIAIQLLSKILNKTSFTISEAVLNKIKESFDFIYCLCPNDAILYISALQPLYLILQDSLLMLFRKYLCNHSIDLKSIVCGGLFLLVNSSQAVTSLNFKESIDDFFPTVIRFISHQEQSRFIFYKMYSNLTITPNLIDLTAKLLENDFRSYITDDSELSPFDIDKINKEIGIETVSKIIKCVSNVLCFHNKSNITQDSNDFLLLMKKHLLTTIDKMCNKIIEIDVVSPEMKLQFCYSFIDIVETCIEYLVNVKNNLEFHTFQKIQKLFSSIEVINKEMVKLNNKSETVNKFVKKVDTIVNSFWDPSTFLFCLEFVYSSKNAPPELNNGFLCHVFRKFHETYYSVNDFESKFKIIGSLSNASKLLKLLFSAFECHFGSLADHLEFRKKTILFHILEDIFCCLTIEKNKNQLADLISSIITEDSNSALELIRIFERIFSELLQKKCYIECKVVLKIIRLISTQKSFPLETHINWLMQLFIECEFFESSLLIESVEYLLFISPFNFNSEFIGKISTEIRGALGNYDESIDSHPVVTMKIIQANTCIPLINFICNYLFDRISDVEWILNFLKLHGFKMPTDYNTLDDKYVLILFNIFDDLCEKIIAISLSLVEIICALLSPQSTEIVAKIATQIFGVVTNCSKLVLSLKRYPSKSFLRLLELIGRTLTSPVYYFISCSQNISKSKSKVVRESKLFPNLIFKIEQHEHMVLKLTNITKIDMARYLPVTKSRDFSFSASLHKTEKSTKAQDSKVDKTVNKRKLTQGAANNKTPKKSNLADDAVMLCLSQVSQAKH